MPDASRVESDGAPYRGTTRDGGARQPRARGLAAEVTRIGSLLAASLRHDGDVHGVSVNSARLVGAAVLLLVASPTAGAQGPCAWAALGPGFYGFVNAMTTFDDGTGPALYASGRFSLVSGIPTNAVAKWDGTSWSSIGAAGGNMGTIIDALTVFDDGTGPALYAAGRFLTLGGVAASRIAKWDGSSWSALGSGTDNSIRSLGVFDDGNGAALYVGGGFSTAGGVSASRVAKWDGSSWSAVGSGFTNASVEALTVFDDGTGPALYAGGGFVTIGGVLASQIARWDGTAWSQVGGGIGCCAILAQAVFDDGTGPALFVAGQFVTVSGVPANNIAKWDGSAWSALGSGVSGASSSPVYALAVFDDGTGPALYAGGILGGVGGVVANSIARWDGASWSSVGGGVNHPNYQFVQSLVVADFGPGPVLVAGGHFATAGPTAASNIAVWTCGSTISVSASQVAPGAPVWVNNANLVPGHEYYNLFSFDLCPGGAGTGPMSSFFGCIFTPSNAMAIRDQMLASVGTEPFHVIAPSSYVSWGPFAVGPATVDAVCIDVTGGTIGPVSQVKRIVVQ